LAAVGNLRFLPIAHADFADIQRFRPESPVNNSPADLGYVLRLGTMGRENPGQSRALKFGGSPGICLVRV
jgi:hypothetical protein